MPMSVKTLIKIFYHFICFGLLGGVNGYLWRARQLYISEITVQTVQKNLRKQQAYTQNRPARLRFIRNYTLSLAINSLWQADLV